MRLPILLTLVTGLCLAGCTRKHKVAPSGTPLVKPGAYAVVDLTGPELSSLPRDKTLFLLPVGTVEEHGPHLPAGSDTIMLESEVSLLRQALRAKLPDWYLISLPTVPYGAGGANEISGDPIHPGTYGLGPDTLRAVVQELGEQVAKNGFRWTFVLYTHGAPQHQKAISKACDAVSSEQHVIMANLTGTMWADPGRVKKVQALVDRTFTAEQQKSMISDFHAGAVETSMMLAAAPQRVGAYQKLPAMAANGFLAKRRLAQRADWPGYFGAPALASRAFGEAKTAINVETDVELVIAAIHGDSLRSRPRDP